MERYKVKWRVAVLRYELCFIILHYIDTKMTISCVDMLFQAFMNNKIYIVIVDNCSPNNSGKTIEEYYSKQDNVHVIINQKNEGFAKGNNLGYKWAKANVTSDFMGIINNDIIIEQGNCMDIICSEYNKTRFAILGPDILSLATGKHQNPHRLKGLSIDEVKGEYLELKRRNSHYFLFYTKKRILELLNRERNSEIGHIKTMKGIVNPVLHGACIFLSRSFIDVRDVLFNPETFMFCEEDILHYECQRDGLKLLYCPDIQVLHCEDISTKAMICSRYQREKWTSNESMKSLEAFHRIMLNDLGDGE